MKLREMLPDIWQRTIDSNPLWAAVVTTVRAAEAYNEIQIRALNLADALQEALRETR